MCSTRIQRVFPALLQKAQRRWSLQAASLFFSYWRTLKTIFLFSFCSQLLILSFACRNRSLGEKYCDYRRTAHVSISVCVSYSHFRVSNDQQDRSKFRSLRIAESSFIKTNTLHHLCYVTHVVKRPCLPSGTHQHRTGSDWIFQRQKSAVWHPTHPIVLAS
jgi:hypothetical protein